jgi:hypothetical protein
MSTKRSRTMRRPHPSLILSAALAAVLLVAQTALAANAININVQLPAGFSVSGTVKTTGGAPIVGAGVIASSALDGGYAATTSTGAFSITGLTAGTYKLQVFEPSDANLLDGWWTTSNANRFTTSSAAASTFVLGPNKTGIAIKVPAGFTISGKITTVGGAPLAGVSVGAFGPSYDTRSTDAMGNYTLRGLAAGAYTIFLSGNASLGFLHGVFTTANANHFSVTYSSATTKTVGPNQTGVNAKIPTGYSISGTITNTSGTPLQGVGVSATSPGGYSESATTDATGKYTIKGLVTATYKLGLSASDGPYVDGWYTTANANHFTTVAASATGVHVGPNQTAINSKMTVGFTVTGKVTTTGGAPIADVYVAVGSGPTSAATYTDASGNYKLQGLAAGSYTLGVEPPYQQNYQTGYWNSANANHFVYVAASASHFTLGPSKTGVNIKLPVGFTISGKITKAGAVAVQYALVNASNANGAFGASTIANGTYKIIGLSPGTYKVAVSGPFDQPLQDGFYTTANAAHFTTNSAAASGVTVGP